MAILKLKNFYHHKSPVPVRDVDIEKVIVSNKISSGKKNSKYFFDYFYNDDKVKPLHTMLPKVTSYVKSYDGQTKWMYYLIKHDDLLEKYNSIWDKVRADIEKEFDSEPVYNIKFLKSKIKSHGDEDRGFYDKKFQRLTLIIFA